MFKKLIVRFIVSRAMKRQPNGYITLLYSPAYKRRVNSLLSTDIMPYWIRYVMNGECIKSCWDTRGNVLKAIALHAEELEARKRASKLLGFYRVQGLPLWRWKMVFLPIKQYTCDPT